MERDFQQLNENTHFDKPSMVVLPSTNINPETFGENITESAINYADVFKKTILDQSADYPLPIPIISLDIFGETYPILTKKSYSLFQGKQKSKKTTALAIAIAQYIAPYTSQDNIKFIKGEEGKILFFDNEQGESYAARTMKLILNIAGLASSEDLIYCDLREYSPNERFEIIKAGIESTENVKWVVIDGVVDLMNDFMSPEEAHLTVTDILKLCSRYDIHVSGVLHQNKGQSKDARAHVGSISSQKCEIEIMVERDQSDHSISVVSAKECRGLPFPDFAIQWSKGEMPKIMQEYEAKTAEASKSKKALLPGQIEDISHIEILKKVLKTEKEPKLANFELGLQNEISSWYGFRVPKSIASEYRKYYVDNGLIKTVGERPHTRYVINC